MLVIDDEENYCNAIERCLGLEGYKVFFYNDGYKAIEKIKELEPIDLYIIDNGLKGIKGSEVAKTIKTINPKAKILGISGFTESKIKGLMGKSVDDVLSKPFHNDEELISKVNKLLGIST